MTQETPTSIPLNYAPPLTKKKGVWWRRLIFLGLIAGIIILFAGITAIVVMNDAFSVVLSAPLLFACGIILVVGGLKQHMGWATGIGFLHVLLCLSLVIVASELNPSEARIPFIFIGCIYLAIIAIPTIKAIRKLFIHEPYHHTSPA